MICEALFCFLMKQQRLQMLSIVNFRGLVHGCLDFFFHLPYAILCILCVLHLCCFCLVFAMLSCASVY